MEYKDWLEDIDKKGGELSWILRKKYFPENPNLKVKADLLKNVLESCAVKDAIAHNAEISDRSVSNVKAEASEILLNMAQDFNLTSTRMVGYPVLKVIKRLFSKIMINMEALKNIREITKKDPVVFIPTHRTYVDFLLISLICYDANITLPAICAGSDFQSSKFVGEALRKCGAFFIRRSFNSDNLYWAIFSEYVKIHISEHQRPVEFFVEGQRSRVSKSLWPKLGLLQVVTEPFLRNQTFDTVIVPVTINYDRILETFLYSRELLGSPKPKENVSGLHKVRSILNQNFGSAFVTFGQPLSLREQLKVNRADLSFKPVRDFTVTPDIKKSVANLAHDIICEHNKNNVLTIWPLLASIIRSELDKRSFVSLKSLFEQIDMFCKISEKLGLPIWKEKSIEEDVNYYLQVYADLFTNENGKLYLQKFSSEKSKELPVEILENAIPSLVLSNSSNPASHLFFNHAILLLIVNSNNKVKKEELLYQFKVLRYIFSKEFVYKPGSDGDHAQKALSSLINNNIIAQTSDSIKIIDFETATLVIDTIKPYILAYQNILEKIANGVDNASSAINICRKNYQNGKEMCSTYLQLSSEVIKNVYNLTHKVPQPQNEVKSMLSSLKGLLYPEPDAIRSRL